MAVGFLQDIRAWILIPRRVTFEVSDGVGIRRYGKLPAWHPGSGEEAWFFVP